MAQKIFDFLQSTSTQLISTVLCFAYILLLLFMTYNNRIYREPINTLPKAANEAIELASNVEVGIHFNSFPRFSFKDCQFTFDGIVWFKFDEGAESLETLENFTIKNTLIKNDSKLVKSKPYIKTIDGKVLVSYHVQTTFLTDVRFNKFPISDHRINMLIENRTASTKEVIFNIAPENVSFGDDILIDNWQPVNVHANAGIINAPIGNGKQKTDISYPGANITIDFENVGSRSLISLYFPLFILFFIGLLSLSIGIFDPARLNIIATSLPTLVLFRLVIDAASPEIGYSTHIDFVYYVLVLLSFFILFFQTYLVLFVEKNKDEDEEKQKRFKKILEACNGALFIGILIALAAIMTYDFFH